MININMLKKEEIEIEGEKLLTLEQIADIYLIPNKIMTILFRQEYIGKNILKENIDYYIIPKKILTVFNVQSESEIFLSLSGFIGISLEIIKDSKSILDKKIKTEQFKAIVKDYYCNYAIANNLKLKILEAKECAAENEKENMSVNYMKDNNVTAWRKQSNKAINTLVRISNLSFEEIRQIIYREIRLKTGYDLNARLNNMKKRATLNGLSKTKINSFNYLDVIATDKILINIYLNEISLFAKKYNINIVLSNVA